MIRRITDKILKDVEFDIAREPDPQGHQIERDPDFSIFYRIKVNILNILHPAVEA